MGWIVLTYSLPSKASSSPRVTLWRRLRRLGAIALSGVQILPDQPDCLEAFHWLAQEVQQAKGEALVMRVESFQGMSNQNITQRFREARQEDYAELEAAVTELERILLMAATEIADPVSVREVLEKLYKHHAEIRKIDFFDCPEQIAIAARLKQLSQTLLPPMPEVTVTEKAVEDYQAVQWVTRPRPHVDRLACIWLIRRFINPAAIIRYAQKANEHEVTFDVNPGEFQHRGNLCTFEVMAKSFSLEDAGLKTVGEIVHEIDLRDGRYLHPQIEGIDALLRGWLLAEFTDAELENHGIALFEGLYAACLQGAQAKKTARSG